MEYEYGSFFIGIFYTGNNELLLHTLASITKQISVYTKVSITLFFSHADASHLPLLKNIELIQYADAKDMFIRLANSLTAAPEDYQTLINCGEEFFDGSFNSVNQIFNTFNSVNWLTGIQTYQTGSGFNITLGNTSSRRWSYNVFEASLYKQSGRYIAPASTFWKKNFWLNAVTQVHFVEQSRFIEDLWATFFSIGRLYTCKVYLSTSRNHEQIANLNFMQPNKNLLIEDNLLSRIKEFFFANNIPYLRLFYRTSNKYIPVIRFDHNLQSYFLSDY